jgi:HAD superfamily hydrolase (TIGR01458 family)
MSVLESKSVKAVFLDLSGVLYEGDTLIKGAVDTVKRLRDQDLLLRFVTNTATKSTAQILEKLHHMGIPLEDEELFTAPMAARSLLRRKHWRPHCLVHEQIRSDFAEFDSEQPNCVVVGDARQDLTYDALNQAFRLIKNGAPLIGIGYNRCFKGDEGLMLDAGAFVHALEWAAETDAIITGKPSGDFFAEVVNSAGVEAGECLMVGDDAEADVAAAVEAGLQGVLVRTGKFSPGDEDKLPDNATLIDSIADL